MRLKGQDKIKRGKGKLREREKQADSTNSRYVLTSTKGAYEQLFKIFFFLHFFCLFYSFMSFF